MNETITLKDMLAAKASMELAGQHVVAIELSLDMLDYFRSFTMYPVETAYTRVYGLPIRIVDGVNICRPVRGSSLDTGYLQPHT